MLELKDVVYEGDPNSSLKKVIKRLNSNLTFFKHL